MKKSEQSKKNSYETTDFSMLEIFIWQKNLLQKEIDSMNESIEYFFVPANERMIRKFNAYLILTSKIKFFSTLISQINEAYEDFDEVICLLLGAHYKACLMMLRSHLEISNALVRAIKSNQPQLSFYEKRQKKGERKIQTKTLNISEEWKKEIEKLNDKLSQFVHSTGKSGSHASLAVLPEPTFSERSFNYCLRKIEEVVDHNAGLLKKCLKPELWKQDLILAIFGKEIVLPDTDEYEKNAIDYFYENVNNSTILADLNGNNEAVPLKK